MVSAFNLSLIGFTSFLFVWDSFANYFCNLDCGFSHVCCERFPCHLEVEECGSNAKMVKLSQKDRSLILDLHNKFRESVASGAETRAGNTGSIDMSVLSYSTELEFIAQCWANSCEWTNHYCAATREHGNIGQAMKYFENATDLFSSKYLEEAFSNWTNEFQFLTKEIIDFWTEDISYSNVSSIVDSDVKFVGCGRSYFFDGLMIVCDYAPRLRIHDSLYERAESKDKICSFCGKNITCNKNYPSLCGKMVVDKWIAPFTMKAGRLNGEVEVVLLMVVLIDVLSMGLY